jgi:alkylation response protein AidB-like acyl-CoA dehydrogenase
MNAEDIKLEAKTWIEENFDPELTLKEWLERLADSGWAASTWPVEWFGKGLSNDLANAAAEEFKAVNAVGPPPGLSRMLAAPTIIAHGSDEQKQRYVRAILTGEEAWCQLFSEPGAGSDLASLQTRAVRDGDEWIVNGQKVWTSGAIGADLGMLIARTNPDAPKHRGITYFAFEMDQPGVEVRPLRQMTGGATFAEVFFSDARVPHENIIGGLNEGWACTLTTLANERVGLGGGGAGAFPLSAPGGRRAADALQQKLGEYIEKNRRDDPAAAARRGGGAAGAQRGGGDMMIRAAKSLGRTDDPVIRQELAKAYTMNKISGYNALRAKAAVKAGNRPGPEASLGKLTISRITKHNRDLGMAILGAHGMLSGEDAPMRGMVQMQFLGSPAPQIYGGTDEIQHNIIGERVLGLPKEPDLSKDVPFKELKVGTQRSSD